jgi:hypothetical protein
MSRVHTFWAGLVLSATLAFVLMLPTAIEYAVMAGLSFNALD